MKSGTMFYDVVLNGEEHKVELRRTGDVTGPNGTKYEVILDGASPIVVESCRPVADVLSLLVNHQSWESGLVRQKNGYDVEIMGVSHEVCLVDPRRKSLGRSELDGGGAVITKMPGKVVRLLVNEGDIVSKGMALVVVEAMKMENELKSPKDGTVASILVTAGQIVEANTTLLELE